MSGFEMFCERCGKRYGSNTAAAASLPLARRLLRAVGVGGSMPQPLSDAPFLRFCLACRGYSCPECWNEDAGFCQTCVPLPEPLVVEHVHEPMAAAVAEAPTAPAFDPFATPVAADPLAADSLAADSLGTEPWTPWSSTSTPVVLEPVALEADLAEPVVAELVEEEPDVAEPEEEVAAAEAFVEADPEPAVVEVETVVVQPEAVNVEAEAFVEAEPEPEVATVVVEAEAVVVEPEAVVVEPEAVVVAEPEPEPVIAELEQVPDFAMAERPIELVVADEEPVTELEAESEVRWDWTLEPDDQPEPVLPAEATAAVDEAVQLAPAEDEIAEPIVAVDEEVVVAAEEEAVVVAEEPEPAKPVVADEPVAPAAPVHAPPVFRPLTPLGPIVAPPPPMAATTIPRIEFELPDAPPAFVIAPPRPSPLARPVLPLGLFDGPGPAIRPCPNCELLVSAKAHFCRRCGSAQN